MGRLIIFICFCLFLSSCNSQRVGVDRERDSWREAGFSSAQETVFKKRHFLLTDVEGWQNRDLTAEQLLNWRLSSFSSKEAKMFWRVGIYDPKEASLWKNAVGKFYHFKDLNRFVKATKNSTATRDEIADVISEDRPDVHTSKEVLILVYQEKFYQWLKDLEMRP